MKVQPPVQGIGSLEEIRDQMLEFERTIGRLIDIAKTLPPGESKEKLFYEVSCLDCIVDLTRQALDSYVSTSQ